MGTGGIVYGKFRKFNVEISVFGQAEDDPFSSCSIMHNRLKLYGNYAVISCRLLLLKYNSAVWSPYLKSDIQAIEHVQRRCTKRLQFTATACIVMKNGYVYYSYPASSLDDCEST